MTNPVAAQTPAPRPLGDFCVQAMNPPGVKWQTIYDIGNGYVVQMREDAWSKLGGAGKEAANKLGQAIGAWVENKLPANTLPLRALASNATNEQDVSFKTVYAGAGEQLPVQFDPSVWKQLIKCRGDSKTSRWNQLPILRSFKAKTLESEFRARMGKHFEEFNSVVKRENAAAAQDRKASVSQPRKQSVSESRLASQNQASCYQNLETGPPPWEKTQPHSQLPRAKNEGDDAQGSSGPASFDSKYSIPTQAAD